MNKLKYNNVVGDPSPDKSNKKYQQKKSDSLEDEIDPGFNQLSQGSQGNQMNTVSESDVVNRVSESSL